MPVRAAVMTEPEAPIELWELDDPALEGGSILLETVASEVCGTDVHLHHGRLAGVPYPIVPGHVSVGRVLESRGVDTDAVGAAIGPGDEVTFYDVHETCHACYYCTVARQPNRCPSRRVYGITYSAHEGPLGGWAERVYLKPALAVAGLLVCSALHVGGAAPSEEPDAYGSWMALPQKDWPKIAVVNQIDYTDGHHPVAGCGFLLEVGDEVLAATAKHVLTYFKSAEMDSVDFRGTLRGWKMFPKDRPSEVVVVGELINPDAEESLQRIPCEKDWLLFTVERASKEIQPLRFRTTPLQPGEPVYVIGWRYTEKDCPQIVYEGEYVRCEKGAVQITVEKLIDNTIPGLSGAPVIDARGYLIGIMSRGSGRIQRLSPIEYPRELIKARAER
jgi:hypothetical protein